MFLTWMQLVTIKMNIISDGLQFYVYNTGMTQKAEKSPIFKGRNYASDNLQLNNAKKARKYAIFRAFSMPKIT